jgi:hypothetical protein
LPEGEIENREPAVKRVIILSCLGFLVTTLAFPAEAKSRKRAHLRHYHQRMMPDPYPRITGRSGGSPSYTPGAIPSGAPAIYQPISPSGTPSLRERF